MFDLQDVLLVDPVHICNGTVFEGGVELYGHAQTAEDHVSIAVLAPKCLVADFKTWGAVDCPVNPGHLRMTDTLVQADFTFSPVTPFTHGYVVVVFGDIDKSGQTLAEPHGDLPVHVDGEGFETFLESAHGVVLEGAGIFAQIHASYLCQAKAADGNKPCSPGGRSRGRREHKTSEKASSRGEESI